MEITYEKLELLDLMLRVKHHSTMDMELVSNVLKLKKKLTTLHDFTTNFINPSPVLKNYLNSVGKKDINLSCQELFVHLISDLDIYVLDNMKRLVVDKRFSKFDFSKFTKSKSSKVFYFHDQLIFSKLTSVIDPIIIDNCKEQGVLPKIQFEIWGFNIYGQAFGKWEGIISEDCQLILDNNSDVCLGADLGYFTTFLLIESGILNNLFTKSELSPGFKDNLSHHPVTLLTGF